MILSIVTTLGGLATQWLENKAAKKKATHEKELEIISQTSDWEHLHVKNASNSWKDEWFALLFSIPLIMAFVPSLVPYVEAGFIVLEQMPDWYKGFLGAAVAASFGVRQLVNFKGK